MAVRLSYAALCGAALLAAVASHATGRAKPPDLPQVERPVCAPQRPEMTPSFSTPWDLIGVPEGGQEESEIRTAANRHAAARRLTRCLLLGTHPILPLLPTRDLIDDLIEEDMERGPDLCDPLMVSPATRLIHGLTPMGPSLLTPAVDAIIRALGEWQSVEPTGKPVSSLNNPITLAGTFATDLDIPVRTELHVEIEVAQAVECPFAQEKRDETPAIPVSTTVFTGLDKLTQAEDAYRQGEVHRAYGQLAKAKAYYEKARELASGSRFDPMAAERLKEVIALMKLCGDQPAPQPEAKAVPKLKKKTVTIRRATSLNQTGPLVEQPTVASPDATCPYLKDQAATKPCPPNYEELSDVIGNIEKLEKAEKAFEAGEFFRRGGNIASASFYYEIAQKLAPGSRYDELSGVALKQLAAVSVPVPVAAQVEEQEVPPPLAPTKAYGMSWRELPKDFRKSEPKVSWEEAIENRLQMPINLNYTDVPLSEVLADINAQGLNLVLDYPALEDAEVDLSRPVTLQLDQVSVKAVLGVLLKRENLVTVMEDEVLLVTTEAKTRSRTSVRTFAVGDLLGKGKVLLINSDEATTGTCTPEMLVKFIKQAIDPRSWYDAGGKGTIDFFPLGQVVIVNQSPDVQERVAELLEAVRALNDKLKNQPAEAEEQSSGAVDVTPNKELQQRVHEMLEACQKAYLLGKYGEAEGLARGAMDVDIHSVHSHPLVRNYELFMKITKAKREKAKPKSPATAPAPMRQPELPEFDPAIVPAMDQVLKDGGLELEIILPEHCEEQELPKPPMPEGERLLILDEYPGCEKGCGGDAVQEFLRSIGGAGCAEVGTTPTGSRGSCNLSLGVLSFRVNWEDKGGHGSFSLELRAGPEGK